MGCARLAEWDASRGFEDPSSARRFTPPHNEGHVAMSSKVQGWRVPPGIYANQDFAAIWLKPD
jgi:hypothetical protein